MSEPLPILMENSIQIAWDYLERTGELGEPEIAGRFLLDTIEIMVRQGGAASPFPIEQSHRRIQKIQEGAPPGACRV